MVAGIINPIQQGEVTPDPILPAATPAYSPTTPPDGVSAVVLATGPSGSAYQLFGTDYIQCYRHAPGSNRISKLLITVANFAAGIKTSLTLTGATGVTGTAANVWE
jgi:hypothetical protein